MLTVSLLLSFYVILQTRDCHANFKTKLQIPLRYRINVFKIFNVPISGHNERQSHAISLARVVHHNGILCLCMCNHTRFSPPKNAQWMTDSTIVGRSIIYNMLWYSSIVGKSLQTITVSYLRTTRVLCNGKGVLWVIEFQLIWLYNFQIQTAVA